MYERQILINLSPSSQRDSRLFYHTWCRVCLGFSDVALLSCLPFVSESFGYIILQTGFLFLKKKCGYVIIRSLKCVFAEFLPPPSALSSVPMARGNLMKTIQHRLSAEEKKNKLDSGASQIIESQK